MKNIKIMDLEICKKIDILKEADRIIIYGAADKGKDISYKLREAKIRVDYFCDRDVYKWDTEMDGINIISLFELEKIIQQPDEKIYIIGCIQRVPELICLLKKIKVPMINVITYWGITTALYLNRESIFEKKSAVNISYEIENEQRRNRFIYNGYEFFKKVLCDRNEKIWIVQPGKTASSSLERRFSEQRIPFLKLHHIIYPKHILGEGYREKWEKSIRERKNESLKVIIAVREPLSRDYSAFWQAFTEGLERMYLMPLQQNDFQEMYNWFTEMLLKGSLYTKEILGVSMPYTWNDEFEWFDEQIKKGLGIDVFKYPFDREKGYSIIKEGNVELLLLKVEKLEENLPIISQFVGVENLSRANANVAEDKWYGLAYKEFRKYVQLSQDYVEHYYKNNDKMDYFYTEEEKKVFLDKWVKNIKDY